MGNIMIVLLSTLKKLNGRAENKPNRFNLETRSGPELAIKSKLIKKNKSTMNLRI